MSDAPSAAHRQIAELLLEAGGRATALTGAGVSTASGIPDFRSAGGLWATVDPAQVASTRALASDPARFWRFYQERFDGLAGRSPNPAHRAIAALERLGLIAGVITQNVDGLHHAAGSRNVAEMHGRLGALRCAACPQRYVYEQLDGRRDRDGVPRCDCGQTIRPGIVLFGEALPDAALRDAQTWAADSRLLIAAGSSLVVQPVAAIPDQVLRHGATVVIVNQSPTPYDGRCARLDGDCGAELSAIVDAVHALRAS